MQKVITGKGNRHYPPTGWVMLRPGVRIKAGDRFFEFDTARWPEMPACDVGDPVGEELDIVIRKEDEVAVSDADPDANRVYVVPEGY